MVQHPVLEPELGVSGDLPALHGDVVSARKLRVYSELPQGVDDRGGELEERVLPLVPEGASVISTVTADTSV